MMNDEDREKELERSRDIANDLIGKFREEDIPIPTAVNAMMIAIGNAAVSHCRVWDEDLDNATDKLHETLDFVIQKVANEYDALVQSGVERKDQ